MACSLSWRRTRWLCLFVLAIAATVAPRDACAGDERENVSKRHDARSASSHAHCGLYCLYALLKLDHRSVEFRELVKPEYIHARKGSSLDELQTAAEDNGFYAKSVRRLPVKTLERLRGPAILHVKSDVASVDYDHYVLFVGTQEGKARILDPPDRLTLVSFRELAARWAGNGLVVSSHPIELRAVLSLGRRRWLLLSVVISLLIVLARKACKKSMPAVPFSHVRAVAASVVQGSILGVVMLLAAVVYHSIGLRGLLCNAPTVAAIQEAHVADFIPRLRYGKLRRLMDRGITCIDARFTKDFTLGHLPRAVSIPVDANEAERQETLQSIPKDDGLVVYCQSAGCRFAERVAVKLIDHGYSDVSIFTGGWNVWAAREPEPDKVPDEG